LHFLEALQESPTELIEKDVPQANRKLKVIIGGAGLGGLATAIALRRRGHSVMVFEKAAKLAEVSRLHILP
jgi:salicylate hydroxylase